MPGVFRSGVRRTSLEPKGAFGRSDHHSDGGDVRARGEGTADASPAGEKSDGAAVAGISR